MSPEIAFGVLSLLGAAVLAWSGGPFGWTFALIYGGLGVDLLWSVAHTAHLRRKS